MKKALIAIFLAFLIFGCINPPQPPVGNGTVVKPPEGNQTVVVVVEPQKNETIVKNETEITNNGSQQYTGPGFTNDTSATLGLYFIPVCSNGEHGAAILIKKGDFDVLVDGGSTTSYGAVIDFLKSKNVDDIDVLISTSGDPRRYGGLSKIASEFTVEDFWWSGTAATQDYQSAMNALSAKAKKTRLVKAGSVNTFNGIKLEALNPPDQTYGDVNNDAIVLRVQDRNLTVLLLSNVQTGAQGHLIGSYASKLTADVMEAPYYGVGAGTANINVFLQTSKPKYVVIEGCEENLAGAGTASREPFKRAMDQFAIPYYETYSQGVVKVTSTDAGYVVTSES